MSATRQRRLRGVAMGAALLGIVAAVCWFLLREPTDIRYRAAGDPRRDIVGITADGRLMTQSGAELHLIANAVARSDTVLALPEALREFNQLHVQTSDDAERFIAVTDRGLAVWRAEPPHELTRHWVNDEDPLAGRALEEGYQWRRRFQLAQLISPDGRLAANYPVEQHGERHGDARVEGTVVIRDLETGEDVASLIHPNTPPILQQVAWSGDSRRLATCLENEATIWSVVDAVKIASFPVAASNGEMTLSNDGERLLTRARDRITRITLYNVNDGSTVATHRCGFSHGMACSADGKYLLVGGIVGGAVSQFRNRAEVAMLDAKTLAPLWTSFHHGACGRIAFSPDGKTVALGWRIPNEIFGSATGVKAWDVADGTVVLVGENCGSFLGFDSSGQIVADFEIFREDP
jgi:hypothetical protein